MNNVFLIGRLSERPELRQTNNGKCYVKTTVAVPRLTTDAQADFIGITVWNKTAELLTKFCDKGSMIAVQGKIQTGSYEKEGRRFYTTDVLVERLQFLSPKPKATGTQPKTEPVKKQEQVVEDPFKDFGESVEISDDELPWT